ncbi:ThiF family adenylyltransferase [Noviherbaspirillum pedocola]|uniref:ThiF family adenylyltransferase n=1 Tax=Noviherbaspirillum pedocola TaxID=2801341 RepID=A0A934SXM9_9BURK|nr:ThiF family adenylyltransferase [Noviherbaspirillum pedocola]MBK4733643.1 ThiF family adenylyltransferase [Noviherbaspirillum pedocola]
MNKEFDYQRAFSRNIGWVTVEEQGRLRGARAAIAGLGGVGGSHLLTLARLGIGNFNIADFDHFEVHNFNRQAGAMMSTLGEPKAEVMARMARDINPEADVRVFGEGVTPENVDDFLKDVDIYVDSIDYFSVESRRLLFAESYRRGIPAVTAAPLGMGVGFLYFEPGKMSFEDYFQLEGHSRREQLLRFMAGLAPKAIHRHYLVVPEAVNFKEERGPSTGMSCDLCAGFTGTQVLKILLGRGKVRAVPWSLQFDAYAQKLAFTWRPGGNANPMQKLLLAIIRRHIKE